MSFFGRGRALLASLTGRTSRTSISIRSAFSEATDLLNITDRVEELETTLNHLQANQSKSGAERAVIAIDFLVARFENDLHTLVRNEVQVIFYILRRLKELIAKIDALRQQVPQLDEQEKKFTRDLFNLQRLLEQINSPFQRLGQSAHINKHFFSRDLRSNALNLLRNRSKFESSLRSLDAAIEKHILSQVLSSTADISVKVNQIYSELERMMLDTFAVIKVFLEELHKILIAEKRFANNPKIRDKEAWLEREIEKLMVIARQTKDEVASAAAMAA